MVSLIRLIFLLLCVSAVSQHSDISINSGGESTDLIEYTVGEIFVIEKDSVIRLDSPEIESSIKVIAYPNPFENYIRLKANIDLSGEIIAVYDATGKLVLTQEIRNSRINLPTLSLGIYLVKSISNKFIPIRIVKH